MLGQVDETDVEGIKKLHETMTAYTATMDEDTASAVHRYCRAIGHLEL